MARIDRDVPFDAAHPFAKAYRDAVYELEQAEAREGTAWHKSPNDMTTLLASDRPT